jgi:import receptor subunit TOM22
VARAPVEEVTKDHIEEVVTRAKTVTPSSCTQPVTTHVMSTASNNSNESMPDESMEVIGPEDLEDSPPPADVEIIGSVEEVSPAPEEVSPAPEEVSLAPEEVSPAQEEFKENESDPPADDKEASKTIPDLSAGDSKALEEVPEANVADKDEDPPIEILEIPNPVEQADPEDPADLEVIPVEEEDPPVEVLGGARVEPLPVPPVAQSQPQVVATRPAVTPGRPAATLEEEDDEEDDDDIDETLAERLVGLTEMFPQFLRTGSVSLVKGSWSFSQASFSFVKAATWVVFSTATIMFMPIMIETERLQLQDQQKAQKNQILLGPGMAQSGGPSLGPPPI